MQSRGLRARCSPSRSSPARRRRSRSPTRRATASRRSSTPARAARGRARRPCAPRRNGLGQHLPRPRPDGAVRRHRRLRDRPRGRRLRARLLLRSRDAPDPGRHNRLIAPAAATVRRHGAQAGRTFSATPKGRMRPRSPAGASPSRLRESLSRSRRALGQQLAVGRLRPRRRRLLGAARGGAARGRRGRPRRPPSSSSGSRGARSSATSARRSPRRSRRSSAPRRLSISRTGPR